MADESSPAADLLSVWLAGVTFATAVATDSAVHYLSLCSEMMTSAAVVTTRIVNEMRMMAGNSSSSKERCWLSLRLQIHRSL